MSERGMTKPKRYDYATALWRADPFASEDPGSDKPETRRILRRLVREAVNRCADTQHREEKEFLRGEADRIAKELIP